jgi:hypothetical protein
MATRALAGAALIDARRRRGQGHHPVVRRRPVTPSLGIFSRERGNEDAGNVLPAG